MKKTLGSQIVLPSQAYSAIPIVAPSDGTEGATIGSTATTATTTTTKVVLKPSLKASSSSATKRLCRNVIIHGFCKYEGKGCEFNHDTNNNPQKNPENNINSSSKSKLRVQSPVFQPTSVIAVVDSVNAPEFIPKSNSTITTNTTNNHDDNSSIDPTLSNSFAQFNLSDNVQVVHPHQSPPHMYTNLNQMDPYYYMSQQQQQQQQQIYPRQVLQHHLYAPSLPHVTNLLPHQRTIQSLFIPDDLRQYLTERNEAQLQTVPACDLGLPSEVHVYHSLYPLDRPIDKAGNKYSHPSWIYKAICSVDGRTYTLVRIQGFRLVNEMAMTAVESWSRIRHCNIVSVREAFTTRAFGDSSLVFVLDYHPCSTTLYHEIQDHQKTDVISESTLWSYIVQIASAIQVIHHAGLAARNIDINKIIVTGKNRIKLNQGSIVDVLQYDNNNTPLNLARYQQEDLLSFGKLIVTLASNSSGSSTTSIESSFDLISHYYSPEFKNAILYLLSNPTTTKKIDDFVTLISPFILQEINATQFYNDRLESELGKELENGRLVRLLSKMGFINERPEFDMDPSWSETGDRYLIKLFRDYVFHQVDENGRPEVDMVHVITCLNKLDAGLDEKIMLMSRDDQSCLIVSYKEIKNCILSAFTDVTSGRK